MKNKFWNLEAFFDKVYYLRMSWSWLWFWVIISCLLYGIGYQKQRQIVKLQTKQAELIIENSKFRSELGEFKAKVPAKRVDNKGYIYRRGK